jgi:WD40 repeat protein
MCAYTIYAWANCGVIISAVCPSSPWPLPYKVISFGTKDPITSILPTADAQTLLVASLDGAVRLMDLSTGKQLNEFKGHQHTAYRLRACFGHAEASVLCGDEDGRVWAWDLLDVRILSEPSFIC